jgi:hypothetical protein
LDLPHETTKLDPMYEYLRLNALINREIIRLR